MCESAHPNPQCPHTYGSHYFLRDESEKKVILVGYPRAAAPVMEDASVDDERFGALRLPRGGKHGYRGVRGGQGKKRDRFQAYTTVASTKVTVPGLFRSAHEAAVALALWKQQHELGIDEEPAPKKARKKRSSALAERPSTSCGSAGETIQLPRMPLQLIQYPRAASPLPAATAQPATPVTTTAVQLPPGIPAAAYGVPVTLGQLV